MKRKTRLSLLATVMMLAMLMPFALSCSEDGEDAAIEATTDLNGLLFSALTGLVGGFSGAAGNQLWGWMMGGGQSAGLSMILSELTNIENTLTDIDTELQEIVNELEVLACDFESVAINSEAATDIDTWYSQYQTFLTLMQDGSTPSVSTLQTWADGVINGDGTTQSVIQSVQQLRDVGTAGGGSSGSIQSCVIAAGLGKLYEPNMLDDRPYYNTFVLPIQNWYLIYNTRAMLMLTEAYHFQAACPTNKQGQPTCTSVSSSTELISTVCPSENPPAGCLEPGIFYNQAVTGFFVSVKAEFAAGGAPYSTNDFVLQIGTDYLLATSIENYNEAAGDNCPSPLTSEDPCGVTVGKYNDAFTSIQYGPYNYGDGNGTWETAPEFLFNNLFDLGGWNGSTDGRLASDYLCTMSLSGGDRSTCTQDNNGSSANGGQGLLVGKKIIQFNETATNQNGETDLTTIWKPWICFFDGNITAGFSDMPFCQEQKGTRFFNLNDEVKNKCKGGEKEILQGVQTRAALANGSEGSNTTWYAAAVNGCNLHADPNPQYCTASICTTSTQEQFRWPALNWTQLTCSDSSNTPETSTNPAGAPTLCGQDFDIWFNNLVPPNDA